MERFLLAATIALALLITDVDTAVGDGGPAGVISSHETPVGEKECDSRNEFYAPLTASARVPCRSARRVLRRCDRSARRVGSTWRCPVLQRTWRCRITGEDDDGVFTTCRSGRYRIRWEWCTTCNP